MKKIAFLIVCTLFFASCDVEDDYSQIVEVYAEVAGADLPEALEWGKVITIDVTYLLPDACHSPRGIYASRGGNEGPARRDIYIAGVASRPLNPGDCNKENAGLERESSFALRVDETEAYTCYLWKGIDENDKSIYTKIIIPVIEESPSTATE